MSDQLAPFALWTALPPSLAGRCSGDCYLHKLTVTEGPGTSALAFPPDGRTLATGAVNGKVRLWDPRTGTARRTWVAQAGPVPSTVYSPEGTLMATSGADGTAALWDAHSGKQIGAPLIGPSQRWGMAAFHATVTSRSCSRLTCMTALWLTGR